MEYKLNVQSLKNGIVDAMSNKKKKDEERSWNGTERA
jgi:hypothetical protein